MNVAEAGKCTWIILTKYVERFATLRGILKRKDFQSNDGHLLGSMMIGLFIRGTVRIRRMQKRFVRWGGIQAKPQAAR